MSEKIEVKQRYKGNARPLTEKERAYLAYRIANPKSTKPEAIKATYNVKPDAKMKTLQNMATTIENRPAVLAILTEHARQAEKDLKELATASKEFALMGGKEGAMYASTAEKTLNSILDRVHGKARQQIEVQSTSVSIAIDLTSDEIIEQE